MAAAVEMAQVVTRQQLRAELRQRAREKMPLYLAASGRHPSRREKRAVIREVARVMQQRKRG